VRRGGRSFESEDRGQAIDLSAQYYLPLFNLQRRRFELQHLPPSSLHQ
jgi:hypothetical protein